MALRELELQQSDSPHILFLVSDEGVVIGNFRIRKSGGNQTLEIACSEAVTLELISAAWEAAEGWVQHYLVQDHPEGAFEALRVIELTNGYKIAWYVYHKDESPADSLQEWGPDWEIDDISRYYGFDDSDYCYSESGE